MVTRTPKPPATKTPAAKTAAPAAKTVKAPVRAAAAATPAGPTKAEPVKADTSAPTPVAAPVAAAPAAPKAPIKAPAKAAVPAKLEAAVENLAADVGTKAVTTVEKSQEMVKQAAAKGAVEATKTVKAAAAVPAAASRAAAPATAKSLDQAVTFSKEQVEKMSKQVFNAFDDVAGFHKENVDAFMASSTILAKGFESLSKEMMAFNQGQYESAVSTAKALMGVKSVKELVDLQTSFAKASFDAFMAEATKVSEVGMKVVNEAAEPLTARVNATVEKISKVKAAA